MYNRHLIGTYYVRGSMLNIEELEAKNTVWVKILEYLRNINQKDHCITSY